MVIDGTSHPRGRVAKGQIPEMRPAQLPDEPWSSRVLTGVSAALDASMVRAMQIVVERVLIPKPEDIAALRSSAEQADTVALREDPRCFFDFLDAPSEPRVLSRCITRSLPGGTVSRVELDSDYEPFGFDHDASPSRSPIQIEHWVHRDSKARGTMLTLHGFMMGNPRIDAVAMMARDWYREGLDVALMTLPYHSSRTPRDSNFSGDRFAVPHVTLLGEAVREAIYEIDGVVRHLRRDSERPVGLLGLSLGGYLSSLYAGLSDAPDWVIPLVAPVCIGDLAWRFMPTRHMESSEGDANFTREELRAAYRMHSPLAHSLKIPRGNALIIGGRGDRIVPPEHPHALWHHWGQPNIHWFSGSHLAPFGRRRVVDAIVEHLRRIRIL